MSPASVASPSHPADLVDAGSFRAVAARIDALDYDALEPAHRQEVDRLRGRLAVHLPGSLPDLVRGANLELAAPDGEPSVVSQAVRRLSLVGADSVAATLLGQALATWPQSSELRFVEHQIKAGRTIIFDEVEQRAVESVVSVQAEYGRRVLSDAAEDESLDAATRLRLHRLLARSLRAERLHHDAAKTLAQLESLTPGADAIPALLLTVALDLWATGEVEPALAQLARVRAAATASDGNDPALARTGRTATLLTEVLDLDPAATAGGPRWATNSASYRPAPAEADAGRACLRSVASRLGFTVALPVEAPTTAHVVQAAQQAGSTTIRVTLDPEHLPKVLDENHIVVLEEDRLDGTGFISLIDVDPVARIMLVADPRSIGPELITIDEWTNRSGIHQWSALVISAPGNAGSDAVMGLVKGGIAPDPVLERLDACAVGPDGVPPPADEVLTTISRVVAEHPNRALAHRMLGETIVKRLPDSNRASEMFERWVLDTRRIFPTAAWPLRIHGDGLLALGRPDEALALMSQAVAQDPLDARNHLGAATAAFDAGELDRAEAAASDALALDDSCVDAFTIMAELAIADRPDKAHELAQIAEALHAEDGRTLALVATLHEQAGRSDDAVAALQRAATADPPAALAQHRLVRHHERHARWDDATTAATGILRTEPSESRSWAAAAWIAHRRSATDEALERWLSGIQCCGATRELVEGAATTTAALAPPDHDRTALDRLLSHLGNDFDSHHVISAVLADHGHIAHAVEVAERAVDLRPGSINGPFRLAQRLASDPRTRQSNHDRLVQLLEDVVAQAGDFAPPRVLLADLYFDSDPERAIALIRDANTEEAPALVFGSGARLLDRYGDPGSSGGVRAALAELRPSIVLEFVPWLTSVRLDQLLLDTLITSYGAHRDSLELAAQLGFALDAVGRPQEGLDLVRWVQQTVPELLDVHGYLSVAERSGAWQDVVSVGEAAITRLTSDTRFEGDVWPLRARVAAAYLALGQTEPRAAVLELAPQHHEALFELARVGWLAQSPHAGEDATRLRQLAPGQADRFELLKEGIVR